MKVRISKMDVEQVVLLTLDAGPKSHEGVLKFKRIIYASAGQRRADSSRSGQLETRWENSIKTDLREEGCEYGRWIELAHDRVK
jgi:hypothetical protein